MSFSVRLSLVGLLAVSLFEPCNAAVLVPFTETFSNTANNGFDFEPFIDGSDAGYSFAVNQNGQFAADLTTGSLAYSSVQTSGVPSSIGTKVTVRSDFTLIDDAEATTRLGFMLFGTDPLVATAGAETYLAYIAEPGGFGDAPDFGLRRIGTSPNGTAVNFSDPFTTFTGPMTGTTFSLVVDATILDGSLQVDYTITDLNNISSVETGQVSVAFTSAPTGSYFGFHVDRNNAGPSPNIAFDNFSVSAVPEPSALALVAAFGLLSTVGLRKRPGRKSTDRRPEAI